jgi:hypothetical protein
MLPIETARVMTQVTDLELLVPRRYPSQLISSTEGDKRKVVQVKLGHTDVLVCFAGDSRFGVRKVNSLVSVGVGIGAVGEPATKACHLGSSCHEEFSGVIPGDQGNLGGVCTEFLSHGDSGASDFDAGSHELDSGSSIRRSRTVGLRNLKGVNLIVETLNQSFGFGELGGETIVEAGEDIGGVGSCS